MTKYLLIALFAVAIFSIVSYFFSINLLYKRRSNKSINYKNEFPFESVPYFKTTGSNLNLLLFLSLTATLAGFALFTVNYFGVIPLLMTIVFTLMGFFIGALPFVSLAKIKEHLYMVVGAIVSDFLISALITYLSYSVSKMYDYQKISPIIAIVISAILLIKSIFFILNPKLFNLRYVKNEKDELVRPKFVPLAFYEWSVLVSSPIYLLVLMLLSTAIVK